MNWNFDQKLVNAAQKPHSDDFPLGGVIWAIIALTIIVVLFNANFIAQKIVDQKLGFSQLELLQAEFDIRDRYEVHLAKLQALRAEGDAVKRLNKLARSARTEKERAFLHSEIAKHHQLKAAREAVFEQIDQDVKVIKKAIK